MGDEGVAGRAATQPAPVEGEQPAQTPPDAPRSTPNQPSGGPGSGRRMRARLARMATKSQPGNPVLEPLLRIVRSNDPKIETSTLRQIASSARSEGPRWPERSRQTSNSRREGEPRMLVSKSCRWLWQETIGGLSKKSTRTEFTSIKQNLIQFGGNESGRLVR